MSAHKSTLVTPTAEQLKQWAAAVAALKEPAPARVNPPQASRDFAQRMVACGWAWRKVASVRDVQYNEWFVRTTMIYPNVDEAETQERFAGIYGGLSMCIPMHDKHLPLPRGPNVPAADLVAHDEPRDGVIRQLWVLHDPTPPKKPAAVSSSAPALPGLFKMFGA